MRDNKLVLHPEIIIVYNRPVTGGGVVCTCWDIGSVNFLCFLKTSILQLRMMEHLKVRQECYRIENHYFKYIPKIKKKESSIRFNYTALSEMSF